MPRALSMDLRERVIRTRQTEHASYTELAARFGIGEATVDRWLSRFRRTGSVAPECYKCGRKPKVDGQGLQVIAAIVAEKPDRTVHEIVAVFAEREGKHVSRPTMNRWLLQLGLSRKKRASTRPSANKSA